MLWWNGAVVLCQKSSQTRAVDVNALIAATLHQAADIDFHFPCLDCASKHVNLPQINFI